MNNYNNSELNWWAGGDGLVHYYAKKGVDIASLIKEGYIPPSGPHLPWFMIHDSGNLPGGIKIEKIIKTKGNKKRGERDTGVFNDTPKVKQQGIFGDH